MILNKNNNNKNNNNNNNNNQGVFLELLVAAKNLTLIIKIKLAYMARNMFIQKTLIMRISTYIIQTHKNYDIYVFKKGSSYKVK